MQGVQFCWGAVFFCLPIILDIKGGNLSGQAVGILFDAVGAQAYEANNLMK